MTIFLTHRGDSPLPASNPANAGKIVGSLEVDVDGGDVGGGGAAYAKYSQLDADARTPVPHSGSPLKVTLPLGSIARAPLLPMDGEPSDDEPSDDEPQSFWQVLSCV